MESQFEEIVGRVPELADLDDGVTVSITQNGQTVRLPGKEFDGWVQSVLRSMTPDPSRWFDGLEACASESRLVQQAVVRQVFNELAGFVLDDASAEVIPGVLDAMRDMALSTRGQHDATGG